MILYDIIDNVDIITCYIILHYVKNNDGIGYDSLFAKTKDMFLNYYKTYYGFNLKNIDEKIMKDLDVYTEMNLIRMINTNKPKFYITILGYQTLLKLDEIYKSYSYNIKK